MTYSLEERETVIRYDEQDNNWTFESNVRKHMTKILKPEEAFMQIALCYCHPSEPDIDDWHTVH